MVSIFLFFCNLSQRERKKMASYKDIPMPFYDRLIVINPLDYTDEQSRSLAITLKEVALHGKQMLTQLQNFNSERIDLHTRINILESSLESCGEDIKKKDNVMKDQLKSISLLEEDLKASKDLLAQWSKDRAFENRTVSVASSGYNSGTCSPVKIFTPHASEKDAMPSGLLTPSQSYTIMSQDSMNGGGKRPDCAPVGYELSYQTIRDALILILNSGFKATPQFMVEFEEYVEMSFRWFMTVLDKDTPEEDEESNAVVVMAE